MDDRDGIRQNALQAVGYTLGRADAVHRLIGEACSRIMLQHQRLPPQLLWLAAVGVGTPRGTKRDKQAMRITTRMTRAQLDSGGEVIIDGDVQSLFWDQAEIGELARSPRLRRSKHRWCNYGVMVDGAPSSRLSRILTTFEIEPAETCNCGRALSEHISHHAAPAPLRQQFVAKLLSTCVGTRPELHQMLTGRQPGDPSLGLDGNGRLPVRAVAADPSTSSSLQHLASNTDEREHRERPRRVRFREPDEENYDDRKIEPLHAVDVTAFPTEQRLRAKAQEAALKAGGKAKTVRKKPQIVEQHFDDCGSCMDPLLYVDALPFEAVDYGAPSEASTSTWMATAFPTNTGGSSGSAGEAPPAPQRPAPPDHRLADDEVWIPISVLRGGRQLPSWKAVKIGSREHRVATLLRNRAATRTTPTTPPDADAETIDSAQPARPGNAGAEPDQAAGAETDEQLQAIGHDTAAARRAVRGQGVDLPAQASTDDSEWMAFDLGRALRLLHNPDEAIVRRTLRRLHIRFWHCPAKRLEEILKTAGAPRSAIKLCKEVVETCRSCRMWTRPGARSVTATLRLAQAFNEIVQWDILFHRRHMISHLIDEAIRFSAGGLLASKTAEAIISAITVDWCGIHGPMRVLVADQERGLMGDVAASWMDRWQIQLRSKEPGAHAQIVERHHDMLRQLLHRVEKQVEEEGLNIPLGMVISECFLAKNLLTSIGGVSPYQALYGRVPPILSEFEPQSDTQLDDSGPGVPGVSRGHHRLRELAVQTIVELTAKQRLDRALKSKTRRPAEQLELQAGDLVDFYRQPTTKDDSGWRGPATVVTVESGTITVRWQERFFQCRTQDIRRALVMFAMLARYEDGHWPRSSPTQTLKSFADSLDGKMVRLGWVLQGQWHRLSTNRRAAEVLHAALHVAACGLHLRGCIGVRVGRGVRVLEGILDMDASFLWWWAASRPSLSWYYHAPACSRINLQELFGPKWQDTSFVQFVLASEEQVRDLRDMEVDVPNIGGPFDPDVDQPMQCDPHQRDDQPAPAAPQAPQPPPPPGPAGAARRERSRSRDRSPASEHEKSISVDDAELEPIEPADSRGERSRSRSRSTTISRRPDDIAGSWASPSRRGRGRTPTGMKESRERSRSRDDVQAETSTTSKIPATSATSASSSASAATPSAPAATTSALIQRQMWPPICTIQSCPSARTMTTTTTTQRRQWTMATCS